jgi:hypothetical protein
LSFEGADRIEVDAAGDLLLHTQGVVVRQRRPFLYQEASGVRREVAGRYVRRGARAVGFAVGAYDRALPLVIDPVLAYSTFLGGANGTDVANDIKLDAGRNASVVGQSNATNYPVTPDAYRAAPVHDYDAVVTKLNASGSNLIYSTYIGGVGSNDVGAAVAVDAVPHAGRGRGLLKRGAKVKEDENQRGSHPPPDF